jgi:hypothetical protein
MKRRPDPAASTPTDASSGPRAAYPGSRAGLANLVGNGHACWEVSHPYTRFPMALRSSIGIGPRCSMMRRKEGSVSRLASMQGRAGSMASATTVGDPDRRSGLPGLHGRAPDPPPPAAAAPSAGRVSLPGE